MGFECPISAPAVLKSYSISPNRRWRCALFPEISGFYKWMKCDMMACGGLQVKFPAGRKFINRKKVYNRSKNLNAIGS